MAGWSGARCAWGDGMVTPEGRTSGPASGAPCIVPTPHKCLGVTSCTHSTRFPRVRSRIGPRAGQPAWPCRAVAPRHLRLCHFKASEARHTRRVTHAHAQIRTHTQTPTHPPTHEHTHRRNQSGRQRATRLQANWQPHLVVFFFARWQPRQTYLPPHTRLRNARLEAPTIHFLAPCQQGSEALTRALQWTNLPAAWCVVGDARPRLHSQIPHGGRRAKEPCPNGETPRGVAGKHPVKLKHRVWPHTTFRFCVCRTVAQCGIKLAYSPSVCIRPRGCAAEVGEPPWCNDRPGGKSRAAGGSRASRTPCGYSGPGSYPVERAATLCVRDLMAAQSGVSRKWFERVMCGGQTRLAAREV